jgi:type IV pilus assembly protein PilY1
MISKSVFHIDRLTISKLLPTLLLITTASPVVSDDIQVYLQQPPNPVPPNILFVLDESGSMNGTPMQQLQNALTTIVNNPNMSNVNIALLGYSSTWPNNVRLFARSGNFQIIGNNIANLTAQINGLTAGGGTPTTPALAAAVSWFQPTVNTTDTNNFALVSPLVGAQPQNMFCAPNHVVLLSDGAPNTNPLVNNGVGTWNGAPCQTRNNTGEICATEIATWAFNTDLMTANGWTGSQNITVSTMGFNTANNATTTQFLTNIATSGGGQFYQTNTNNLVTNLTNIITSAQQNIAYTYNAPSIPFNSDNTAISGTEIYLPFLEPSANLFWKGNLKKYNVNLTNDQIVITDAVGSQVINSSQQFLPSQDLWASGNDGGNVLIGGAAGNMNSSGNRMLFSNVDGTPNLSAQTNRVVDENQLITMAMLGVATTTARTTLLDWISWDANVAASLSHEGEMGAPIHTQPAVVEYGNQSTVYIPTSEGVLEAYDADTGQELWAFMPQDILNQVRLLMQNSASTVPYYGLDGPLTVYETGNTKMAIVGKRRGGNEYYLLNINNRLNPQLVTVISGDDPNGAFNKLGQTWSKPQFVQMMINGSQRDVLVFGGGYDSNQDNVTTRTADAVGNVIYIVDAQSGNLLSSISNSGSTTTIAGMTNAIPGDVMTVDLNGDALVDRLYAADVGGRIIRVDIDNMSGGIVADINAGSNQYRRFFNTPQVGYYSKGGKSFLAILIGSGNRVLPLDSTVTDRFYMIMDEDIWSAPGTYTTVTESDLIDASSTAIELFDSSNISKKGWYMNFSASEKSYSRAILYDYAIFFTTYSAITIPPNGLCNATGAAGTARLYGLNLITANAAIDWSNGTTSNTPLTIADRSTIMSMPGIPPSPMLIFPGETDTSGDTVLGKKIFLFSDLVKKAEWNDRFRPVHWEEVINDGS